jgi:uncharacterized DUF497 family protein
MSLLEISRWLPCASELERNFREEAEVQRMKRFVQSQWDAKKDAENRRKHQLSLADGIPALEDPYAESWIDERYDYGEQRIITLGLTQHGILLVITTEISEEQTRIISVRKAERHEEDWYRHGHP